MMAPLLSSSSRVLRFEHDHDEVWQEAFDKIFEEYNRIGDQMFPAGEQRVMENPDGK